MNSRCESCGRDDEPTTQVRRLYVTPEAWDTPGSTKVVEDVEHWCFVCLSHYPHELVDAG